MRASMLRKALAATLLVGAGCATGGGGLASTPADRSQPPAPGPAPDVDFPEIERFTLSNGMPVWYVEQAELPVVTVQLLLGAGAVMEEPDEAGLASLTADMLTQGTTSRSATEIADEIDFLAASLTAGAGRESAVVSLNTLSRNFDQAISLFADVVRNPAFAPEEWQRVQAQRLAAIAAARDQGGTVASQEFSRLIFGESHAFGRPTQGTTESVQSLTPADLHAFHERTYSPANANLIVVGDIDRTRLRAMLDQHFGSWSARPAPAPVAIERPQPLGETRIYLIDRPGSAQSDVRIGHLGIERSHEDYLPILVMNTILGGQFSSRINLNLREDKGYTYGASSTFQTGILPGPFLAGGAVQTAVTAESIREFMRELEEIRGARPISAEELEFAKAGIIRSEPLSMQTNAQIANRIQQIVLFDLPPDYFDEFNERVAALTLEDVNRVAREYIDPDRMVIVIVGDRAAIEPSLRQLPYPVDVIEPAF